VKLWATHTAAYERVKIEEMSKAAPDVCLKGGAPNLCAVFGVPSRSTSHARFAGRGQNRRPAHTRPRTCDTGGRVELSVQEFIGMVEELAGGWKKRGFGGEREERGESQLVQVALERPDDGSQDYTVRRRHGPYRNQQRCNTQRVTSRARHAPSTTGSTRDKQRARAWPRRSGTGAAMRVSGAPDGPTGSSAECNQVSRRARLNKRTGQADRQECPPQTSGRLGATDDGEEVQSGGMPSRARHTRHRGARGVQQIRRTRLRTLGS
jgi:hypothetical protein